MYNALNEDYMFQAMRDRVAPMSEQHRRVEGRPERRWWRKGARVAR